MKDNTHLFESKYEKLTEEDGVALYNWANSGKVPDQTNKEMNDEEKRLKIIDEISERAKELLAAGFDKDEFYNIVKTICGTKAYNKVSNVSDLANVLEKINELKVEDKDV